MRAAFVLFDPGSRRKWVAGCLMVAALRISAADWPQFRGPAHNGVSAERITLDWSGSRTNPVWLVPLPTALCSVSVSGGRVFTQIRRTIGGTDKETCVALSIADGSELWATPVDDANYPNGGVGYDDGPRSTPVVDNGAVFVLSSYLNLYALNATNGAVLWQRDLRAIYGGDVIPWENAASPLIENGLIYLNANCATSSLVALHTSDGSLAWRSQDEAMTHSTPVLATIHAVRQVIFATQYGLVSLDPQSGASLWRFAYPFSYFISLGSSPVVDGDLVFVSGGHAYGMGSVALQVGLTNNVWTTTQLWYALDPSCHWMTPVARQGFLYGQFGFGQYDTPNALLECVDMRTGAELWSQPGFGRAATLLVDDHLLVITELGDLVLAAPNTNAYTELARFQAIPNYDGDTNKCWSCPAIADGRVYVRSTSFGACFDLSVASLQLDPPQRLGANQFQLTIRAADGSPIDSNRLTGLAVLASTNVALAPSSWPLLTNTLVLSNGVVRVNNVDFGAALRRFFMVTESNR